MAVAVRPVEVGPHSGGGQAEALARFVLEANKFRDRLMPFTILNGQKGYFQTWP
jgi:hypothetical protein